MKNNLLLHQFVSQVDGNVVSDMDGEKVMLSIANNKYYNLGAIGGVIWEQMEHSISIQALIDRLQSLYEVETDVCEKEVMTFLNHLLEENLIHLEESPV
ncbi:lasso peptide biosynthesis PqqD family chaperone [Virgibacillus sp. W0181]|uniref:lasso peptide biosynthesis PqqD family chaperone n=1 Tax=Virgibacillus sp. W0181 TaxID=3391581 RepID=UPI003F4536F2